MVPSQKAWINGEVAGKRILLYVVIVFLGCHSTGPAGSCEGTTTQKNLTVKMAELFCMGIGTTARSQGPELPLFASCRGYIGIPNKRSMNCRWEAILEIVISQCPAHTSDHCSEQRKENTRQDITADCCRLTWFYEFTCIPITCILSTCFPSSWGESVWYWGNKEGQII